VIVEGHPYPPSSRESAATVVICLSFPEKSNILEKQNIPLGRKLEIA
jgi:hypothetical protein